MTFSMAVSQPYRVMLGSCRDLILREPGQLPGPATTNSLPKHSAGNWERVARDLGSTRRASTLGEQGEGSRSRQTRDNITPVLGHCGTARTVLVAGSTSTGRWDLPTLAGLLWTNSQGSSGPVEVGEWRVTAASSSSSTSRMGGGRGRCPLAQTCTWGCPQECHEPRWHTQPEPGVPRAWSLYPQPSQVQPGTQHLHTRGTGHTVPARTTWHTTPVPSPLRHSQELNTCTQSGQGQPGPPQLAHGT